MKKRKMKTGKYIKTNPGNYRGYLVYTHRGLTLELLLQSQLELAQENVRRCLTVQ